MNYDFVKENIQKQLTENYNYNSTFTDLDEFMYIFKIDGTDSLEFLNTIFPGKIETLSYLQMQEQVLLSKAGKILDLINLINFDDYYLIIGNNESKKFILEKFEEYISKYSFTFQDLTRIKTIISLEGKEIVSLLKEKFFIDVNGLRINTGDEFSEEKQFFPQNTIVIRNGFFSENGYKIIFDTSSKQKVINYLSYDLSIHKLTRLQLNCLCYEANSKVFGITLQKEDCPFEKGLKYLFDFKKESYEHIVIINQKKITSKKSYIMFILNNIDNINSISANIISYSDMNIGEVKYLGYSANKNLYFGYAIVNNEFAFPGSNELKLGTINLTTITPPLSSFHNSLNSH